MRAKYRHGTTHARARTVKALTITSIILGAVASATAIACTTCPSTETVRSDEKEITTRAACTEIERLRGGTPFSCSRLCDSSYNECYVDTAYWSAFNTANADAGTSGPFTCPPPADGRAVVKVHCAETEQTDELTFGGGCAIEGRRPANLLPPLAQEDVSSLGGYFASVAHLEAAAVLAFERMVEELEAHGAPPSLVDDAERAREDEIRHARVTTRLARRFGTEPPAAECARGPVRGLFAIALENEIEGVVRETLGAALATWRAEHANDADIRSVMKVIARDERRHAELSWALAEWVRPRLTVEERAQLDEARRAAVKELRDECTRDPNSDVMEIAGVPSAQALQSLLDGLEQNAWRVSSEATSALAS